MFCDGGGGGGGGAHPPPLPHSYTYDMLSSDYVSNYPNSVVQWTLVNPNPVNLNPR